MYQMLEAYFRNPVRQMFKTNLNIRKKLENTNN